MQNLLNVEATDLSPGTHTLDGVWNTSRENDLSEHLTTVTYVARARLEDGTIWNADSIAIAAALESLDLDREIDGDSGSMDR